MKKYLILFMFLQSISSLVFSQQKNNFNNLTSGKWQINSIEIENELIDVIDEDNWMIFYSDGLYQMFFDHEEQIGTWELDTNNDLKFDLEGFDGNLNIRELTQDQFEFSISGYTLALSKS